MINTAPSPQVRSSLFERYMDVRRLSEDLCEPLSKEDYIPQPVAFVSPPKWHLAHTTWFFEAFVLQQFDQSYRVFHEDFSFLFNSYYNAVGERIFRADRGNITRPGVDEVYDYRRYVDRSMQRLLTANDSPKLQELVILGLHHEQQHQELLLTDLKFIFAHNPIFPVYRDGFSLVSQRNDEVGMKDIAGGIYEIGCGDAEFHYDNEKAKHQVLLHDFTISNALVTNGEFIEFVEDGGYRRSEFWLDEGWSWVETEGKSQPLYWHKVGEDWHQYSLSGLQRIVEDEILAHVNYYEAAAFAEWRKMRLPTEFEWEVASDQFTWGKRWEWSNSAYLPYPGFSKAPGAIGEYNGKFMINQMVLRGSSTATSPHHSRKTYRNFFHPHLSWQCTGIRLAALQNI